MTMVSHLLRKPWWSAFFCALVFVSLGIAACAGNSGNTVAPSADGRPTMDASAHADGVMIDAPVPQDGANSLMCNGGTTACGSVCASLDRDPMHCGTCDHACDAGLVCSMGVCAVSCQINLLNCGGACVDPMQDNTYCGATPGCGGSTGSSGKTCTAGQVCSNGGCIARASCRSSLAPTPASTLAATLRIAMLATPRAPSSRTAAQPAPPAFADSPATRTTRRVPQRVATRPGQTRASILFRIR